MARLSGKDAALYLSANAGSTWAWVPDLYDITLDVPQITYAARIKGDRIVRRVPSHLGECKLSARRWVTATSALAALTFTYLNSIDGSTHAFTEGVRVEWAIVGVDPNFPTGGDPAGFSSNSNIKAQGTGYLQSGHIGFPREHIEDDCVIAVDTLLSLQ